MWGWVLFGAVLLAVLLAYAREELIKRRRQGANRESLRLDGPEAYVSAAEASAFYRESERLRQELGVAGVIGGPPAHPNCRCTLAPIMDRDAVLDEMVRNLPLRGLRRTLEEPTELEVNAVLAELERLASKE